MSKACVPCSVSVAEEVLDSLRIKAGSLEETVAELSKKTELIRIPTPTSGPKDQAVTRTYPEYFNLLAEEIERIDKQLDRLQYIIHELPF